MNKRHRRFVVILILTVGAGLALRMLISSFFGPILCYCINTPQARVESDLPLIMAMLSAELICAQTEDKKDFIRFEVVVSNVCHQTRSITRFLPEGKELVDEWDVPYNFSIEWKTTHSGCDANDISNNGCSVSVWSSGENGINENGGGDDIVLTRHFPDISIYCKFNPEIEKPNSGSQDCEINQASDGDNVKQ